MSIGITIITVATLLFGFGIIFAAIVGGAYYIEVTNPTEPQEPVFCDEGKF